MKFSLWCENKNVRVNLLGSLNELYTLLIQIDRRFFDHNFVGKVGGLLDKLHSRVKTGIQSQHLGEAQHPKYKLTGYLSLIRNLVGSMADEAFKDEFYVQELENVIHSLREEIEPRARYSYGIKN